VEVTLTLNDTMWSELLDASRESRCPSPVLFASECVESVLASRRLPRVEPSPYGAQGYGSKRGHGRHEDVEQEFEDAEDAGLVTHRVMIPSDTVEML
jgi:hypothetical protein